MNNNLVWTLASNYEVDYEHACNIDAADAYDTVMQNQSTSNELELRLSKSATWANEYAECFLEAPFPLGEPKLSTHISGVEYAVEVLKSRFKLLEANFSQITKEYYEAYDNLKLDPKQKIYELYKDYIKTLGINHL